MDKRIGERLAAACGALYVVLLVGGDDFINPAGEPPDADAPLREVSAYLDKADSSSFWLGRSIGLLGLCALLVFVVYVSRKIRDEDRVLSGIALTAGSVAVALQFLAAPAQFAAVQGASQGLDPQVAQALLHASVSFQLSFLPLALFMGAVAAGGVLPRWLSIGAGVLGVGLVGGMIGHPEEPAVVSFMAFALGLLWFVATSVALVRRAGRPSPAGDRPRARAAVVASGAIALALALGLAACGDDEDEQTGLSKQEFIAQSGAICTSNGKRADADYKRLVEGAPRTEATAHRFVKESVVPIFGNSVTRRAKLAAPEGDVQAIQALNSAGEDALAEFEQIAAEPSKSADLMLGKIPDPAKAYDARSRRYGITKCSGD
jgi:hypothetical protein